LATTRGGPAARGLTTLFHLGATGELTDGQLLERFSARPGDPDEPAFAALVERHGPVVLHICRSILRDEHEAHDAFQATFLILVRKARSLWVRDSLGPWLHAVALRVASGVRTASARRLRHEHRGAELRSTTVDGESAEARELGALLHEEIGRLPERYRVPIVLCDLEGRTHEQAARHLGWPVGTVKSRQVRGRQRLRLRLVRRGLAPTVGLGLAGWSAVARAALPRGLVVATSRAAAGSSAGSARAVSLTKGVLTMMFLNGLRSKAPSLLAIALAATVACGVVGSASSATRTQEPAPVAPVPKPHVGKIYLSGDSGVVDAQGLKHQSMIVIDPKTGDWTKLFDDPGHRPRVSPDGQVFAFERDGAIWTWNFGREPEPRRVLDLAGASFGTPVSLSPDGKQVALSLGRRDEAKNCWMFTSWRVNADGGDRTELKIPPEDGIQDWSSDGKWLLVASNRGAKIGWQLYFMHPDGTGEHRITEDGNPFYARFSPDGRKVLYSDQARKQDAGIWVVDSDGKNRRLVAPFPDRTSNPSACWSPDGKRIAVVVSHLGPAEGPHKSGKLVVMDLDGTNPHEMPVPEQASDMPDWR
jgi:RNA polymerase sigma factor (sigma-70 family)